MGEFGEEEDEEKVRDFERIGERGRVGRETIFRKVGVFGQMVELKGLKFSGSHEIPKK